MELSKILSLIGYSEQQIKILTESEDQSEIDGVVEDFNNIQKKNIEKLFDKKSLTDRGKAEAFEKSAKAILGELGVELTEDEKKEPITSIVKMAVERYNEQRKPLIEGEHQKRIDELLNSQKELNNSIKLLEKEKSEILENSQKELIHKMTEYEVNQSINSLLLKDTEFTLSKEKIQKLFKFELAEKGYQIKKTENGFEVYDKENNPVKRVVEGSKAIELHTLNTFFEEVTKDYEKKSNGANPAPPMKTEGLTPQQMSMMAIAETM